MGWPHSEYSTTYMSLFWVHLSIRPVPWQPPLIFYINVPKLYWWQGPQGAP